MPENLSVEGEFSSTLDFKTVLPNGSENDALLSNKYFGRVAYKEHNFGQYHILKQFSFVLMQSLS